MANCKLLCGWSLVTVTLANDEIQNATQNHRDVFNHTSHVLKSRLSKYT